MEFVPCEMWQLKMVLGTQSKRKQTLLCSSPLDIQIPGPRHMGNVHQTQSYIRHENFTVMDTGVFPHSFYWERTLQGGMDFKI